MIYRQWIAVLAMAALPAAVMAQQVQKAQQPYQSRQTPTDVTNPAAPTAPPHYQSVFAAYRASSEEDTSPDALWRAANDEMGKLGGHAGHMKGAAGDATEPPQDSAAKARVDNEAAPRPAGKPVDHSKHH